jgi:hypothetical protein
VIEPLNTDAQNEFAVVACAPAKNNGANGVNDLSTFNAKSRTLLIEPLFVETATLFELLHTAKDAVQFAQQISPHPQLRTALGDCAKRLSEALADLQEIEETKGVRRIWVHNQLGA